MDAHRRLIAAPRSPLVLAPALRRAGSERAAVTARGGFGASIFCDPPACRADFLFAQSVQF
jgi:hypothetical protein